MRRISTSTRNRKRERDRDRRRRAKSDTAVEVAVPTAFYDPFQLTTCSICGGIEDEDLIILCDGPGCSNEVHMYCMTPVMTKVPEGDWFCEACDKVGTTKALRQYFDNFAATTKDLSPSSSNGYREFVVMLQKRHIPLDIWNPTAEDVHVASEFDPSSVDLIGGLLRLSISESQHHTGRIVNRRFDTVHEKWEHLVQFKSGVEGRNEPFTSWFCLAEHACLVGGTVKWARIPDFPWWPAVEFYQSGMEKIVRKYREDQPNVTNANRRADKQPIDEILHYFFGDASYALISRTDNRYVVPFFAKSREARIYSAKRLNVAYALACLEREEMLATRRAFHFMDGQQDQCTSILVDGYTTATLKALAEFPTSFNSALQAARAVTSGSGAAAGTSSSAAGAEAKAVSVWELYCKYNQRMLQHEYCLPSDPAQRQLVLTAPMSSSAVPAEQGSVPVPTDGFPIDWVGQPRLCLDRVYLSAELGIDIDAPNRKVLFHPSIGGESAATASTVPSSVVVGNPAETAEEAGAAGATEETSGKRRRVSNSRYVNDTVESTSSTPAATAPTSNIKAEPATVPAAAEKKSSGPLVIKPFSLSDVIFQKYRQEAIRKQDEILAQQAQEEQERLERNAARKARLSELAANPNPWVADGEDFTRKSSRLSSTRGSDGGSDVNSSAAVHNSGKQIMLSAAGGSSSSSVLENDSEVSAATTAVAPKRSTRRSRKRIQEEEEYREFLESSANQPRLLTDLDRDAWIGAVVTYLPTLQKGRVTEYRSGWAIIRTLEGSLNCRPYQLEIVEAESEDMAQLEEAELWALCGEGEGAGERGDSCSHRSSLTVGQVQHASHPMDYSQPAEGGFAAAGEDAMLVEDPEMYFDESDMMYDAFASDQEYDAMLLRQFDIGAGVANDEFGDASQVADGAQQQPRSAPKMSRAEIQAIRLQQQKPSRTKLVDILPAQSEAEKKRKMDALLKSRLQVQQLLRPPAGSNSTAPRSITINRSVEPSAANDIDGPPTTATKPQDRYVPLVTKLGAAPPLAKPSFLRGFGNNWRRPTAEPIRRLSMSAIPSQINTRTETTHPRTDRLPQEVSVHTAPSVSISTSHATTGGAVVSASTGGAGKSQQLTAAQEAQREAELQALRDPRLRARLERTLPAAPTAAPPRPTTEALPTLSNADARNPKNSSSASRAMRANIEYLQSGLAVQAKPDSATNPAAPLPSTRRAVTFNVKNTSSSISGAVIDSDVLDLTDAADMAQFSPNESDNDDDSSVEAETIRFNIRAVDEMDRALPTAQRAQRPTDIPDSSAQQGSPAAVVVAGNSVGKHRVLVHDAATGEQPRKSRFGAVQLSTVPVSVVPQVFLATANLPELQPSAQIPPDVLPIQEHATYDYYDHDDDYGYDYPDQPLSMAERRRQKRHAAARAKHQGLTVVGDQSKEAVTAVAGTAPLLTIINGAHTTANVSNKAELQRDDLEPGEVEDEDDMKSLPDETSPQQFVPAVAATSVPPPLKRSSSALERLMLSYEMKPNDKIAPPRALHTAGSSEQRPYGNTDHERTAPSSRWQPPTTTPIAAVLDVAAVAAALASSASTSTSKSRRKMHINLDKSYPQFNHRENAHLAIAHMDEVMPLSMSNLTTLLTGSDFFPPMGYVREVHFPLDLVQDPRMLVEQEPQWSAMHAADARVQYFPPTEPDPRGFDGYPPHLELPVTAFTEPVYQHQGPLQQHLDAFGGVPHEDTQPRRSRFAASRLSGRPEEELAQLAGSFMHEDSHHSTKPRASRFSAPAPAVHDTYHVPVQAPLFAQQAHIREFHGAVGFRRDDMHLPVEYSATTSIEAEAYPRELPPQDRYTGGRYSNQHNASYVERMGSPRADDYPPSGHRHAPDRDVDRDRTGDRFDGRQRSRWGRN